jgi:hypothetical protein
MMMCDEREREMCVGRGGACVRVFYVLVQQHDDDNIAIVACINSFTVFSAQKKIVLELK